MRLGCSEQEAAQLESVMAATEKEILSCVDDLDGVKVLGAVRDVAPHVGAGPMQRLNKLRVVKEKVIADLEMVERDLADVERALEAGMRLEAVVVAAAATQKALERSKRELAGAKLKQKNTKEDLEEGVGSDEAVAKAARNVAEASEAVEVARGRYEEAMRDLVAVRQAGFPELRCPAPARDDRHTQVPRIAAKDLGELQLMPRLGVGSFASVYQVELPLAGPCAFKKLDGLVDKETLMREAAAMWQLLHSEQVVRLLFVCDEPGSLGLVLEMLEGGSLGALLHVRKERLSEREMLQILHDVARGLECMHGHRQMHLDVKSENVLLTAQRRAKLSDFGSSKEMRSTYRDTVLHTARHWSAPETLADPPKISAACDIWAFGMLMYEVLTGTVPYSEVPERDVTARIAKGATPDVDGIAARFRPVMEQCWKQNHPTASELVALICALMQRECAMCSTTFPLTRGALCTRESTFLCGDCVSAAMESALMTDSAWRADGSLAWRDAVFEMKQMRTAVGSGLFERWQAAQLRANERQVRDRLRGEANEERRQ
jgi:hypothetical protein